MSVASPTPFELQLSRRKLSVEAVASRTQVDAARLQAWLEGTAEPDWQTVCAVADALSVLPEHLLVPPPSAKVLARALASPHIDADTVSGLIDVVDAEMTFLGELLDSPPRPHPIRSPVDSYQEASQLAEVVREQLRYGLDPIVDIFAALERWNIAVIGAEVPGAMEGAAFLFSDGSAGVFINLAYPPLRVRFTAAHELGHHVLDQLEDGVVIDEEIGATLASLNERRANAFAAHLLVPVEAAQGELSPWELSDAYGISMEAAQNHIDNVRRFYDPRPPHRPASPGSKFWSKKGKPSGLLPQELTLRYQQAIERDLIERDRALTVDGILDAVAPIE